MVLKFVRLKSGEDIIADIGPEAGGKIMKLTHPMSINYQYGDTGIETFYLVLSPWISPSLCPLQIFHISGTNIVTISEPSSKLTMLYYATVDRYYQTVDPNKVEIDELDSVSDEDKKAFGDFFNEYLKDLNKKQE